MISLGQRCMAYTDHTLTTDCDSDAWRAGRRQGLAARSDDAPNTGGQDRQARRQSNPRCRGQHGGQGVDKTWSVVVDSRCRGPRAYIGRTSCVHSDH